MPTLFVTAADRGLGLAFARSFAADGWTVHACCRHPDRAEALKAVGGDVSVHRLDVVDGLRLGALARELDDLSIDVLINSALIEGPRSGFGDTSVDDWMQLLRANAIAPLRVAERFVEQVARSERRQIVLVSDRLGSIADNRSGGAYPYRTSMAALNMIGRSLSIDLAGRGIVVALLHPGPHAEDGGEATIGADESVAGMRAVMDRLRPEDSGGFFDYRGQPIPW